MPASVEGRADEREDDMKLFKHVALAGLAIVLSALAAKSAALAGSGSGEASAGSRSIATGSAYSSGTIYVYQNDTTGQRSPLTSVTADYHNGLGSLIVQDVRGAFRASFGSASVATLQTGAFAVGTSKWSRELAGTYTDAAGVSTPAHAYFGVNALSTSFQYWNFSYNYTTSTASAVSAYFTNAIRVTMAVQLDGTYGNTAETGRIWGSNAVVSSQYNFYNESSNTGMNNATLATYGGVLNVKP
jgi:hypothetical protein